MGYSMKIEIEKINKGMRSAFIKPQGFWSKSHIRVYQGDDYGTSVWVSPQIGWGSGGTDGSLSSIEAAESHAQALLRAVEIAREWDKDTGKKVEG